MTVTSVFSDSGRGFVNLSVTPSRQDYTLRGEHPQLTIKEVQSARADDTIPIKQSSGRGILMNEKTLPKCFLQKSVLYHFANIAF
jgi:hypothetical protein